MLLHVLLECGELTLGYRKTAAYINAEETAPFNHKKVYRHMKALKLLQPKNIRKPKLKKQSKVLAYCPLKSNLRWEADLTLVPSESGFLYLFTVIDVFDKEVIGSYFGVRCRCSEAIASREDAVHNRFPEGKVPSSLALTLRLDRGCQFTAENFVQSASKFGLSLFLGVFVQFYRGLNAFLSRQSRERKGTSKGCVLWIPRPSYTGSLRKRM